MKTAPRQALSAAVLLRHDNARMFGKLFVITVLMFGFGYAMVPLYKAICTALGVNVLTLSDKLTSEQAAANAKSNSQIDRSHHG